MSKRKIIWVCILFGGIGALAHAQERVLPQRPSPPPGTVTLDAEVQEQLEKGHVRATGYVDIVSGDVRLSADRVDFWSEEMRVVAEGNVVFQQGDQKIVGDRVEANLENGTGKFYNAYGNAGSDLFFHGEVVEKVDEDTYVVEHGAFTSCAQPTPRWRFTSGKATVHRDHHVSLHSAFVKVKAVPVFYVPYLYYPIDEKGRSTGFLLPEIGNSSYKGFLVSQSFFWAINRSMDATFTADYFDENGIGAGADYRYVLSDESRGQFDSYFLRDKETTQQEWQIQTAVNQALPARFSTIAQVDYFSSFDFQQKFEESFERATQASKRATVNVARSWSTYTLRFLYDRNETLFSNSVSFRELRPRIAFDSRSNRIGSTPFLFGFSSEASQFSRNLRDDRFEYQRFDVLPTISYPFTAWPFLTARTSFITRFTHYSHRIVGGDPIEESLDRQYNEVRIDMRGPSFYRIFDTPDNGYAERWKHVIEPQLVWSYRSRVDDFDTIPKFDSEDYVPGTNQFSLAIVNRFLAKRQMGQNEQSVPYEFLTWTLAQRYFFQVDASLYDRQFSTPYFTEDGEPSEYSPITSKVVFRPIGRISAMWNLEYDVNFQRIRSMSVVGSYAGRSWGSVSGSLSQSVQLTSGLERKNVRGMTTLNVSRTVSLHFESAYDVAERELNLFRAGTQYNIQCCGFQAEYSRYQFGDFRDEGLFRVGITLANIGTFGTSLRTPGTVQ
ncbi:MAG TPA: putative LPS assembly protein LptD [Vicinamibacteria bacterium]